VTGCGTRRIMCRKWVESVSSEWVERVVLEDGDVVVLGTAAAECS